MLAVSGSTADAIMVTSATASFYQDWPNELPSLSSLIIMSGLVGVVGFLQSFWINGRELRDIFYSTGEEKAKGLRSTNNY